MSEDNTTETGSDDQSTEEVTTTQETQVEPTIEALKAELESIKAEAARKEAILEKARKGEKYAKRSKEELAEKLAALEEQGNYKELYESLVAQSNTKALEDQLAKAIEASGDVVDPKAFARLIDRQSIKVTEGVVDTKSLETAIAKTKQEFPGQLKVVDIPEPKRSGENTPQSGFEKEMSAAKTFDQIQAVMRKYNK